MKKTSFDSYLDGLLKEMQSVGGTPAQGQQQPAAQGTTPAPGTGAEHAVNTNAQANQMKDEDLIKHLQDPKTVQTLLADQKIKQALHDFLIKNKPATAPQASTPPPAASGTAPAANSTATA